MIKLDLSKFKHVKSDKKSTTLQHADGHMLTLAHNSLAPESQAQLAALSKVSKQYQTKTQSDEAQNNKMAEGGYASGRDEKGVHGASVLSDNPGISKMGMQVRMGKEKTPIHHARSILREQKDIKPKLQGLAEGGSAKVQAPAQKDPAPQQDNKQEHIIPANVNTPSSMSQAWDRLTHPMASGGKVESGSPDMNMAEGGQPRQMYAEGEDQGVQPEKPQEAAPVMKDDSPPAAAPGMPEKIGHLIGEYGVGPVLEHVTQLGQGAIDLGKGAYNMAKGVVQGAGENPTVKNVAGDIQNRLKEEPPPAPVEQPGPAPQPQQPMPQQAAQPQGSSDPYGYGKYINTVQQGLKQQQTGITQQGAGDMQAAENKARADVAYAGELQHQQDNFMSQFDDNMSNRDAVISDIQNNHIDPKHYMESRTSGQKVAMAIGLMLGGIGASLTHSGVNPMMDFINKQIDRDIGAQKDNQTNRSTLLHAYQDQFKDNNAAELMTRATLAGKYAADIQAAANQAANPQIAGRMLQESGKLQQSSADMIRQATMMKAIMGSAVNPGGQQDSEASFKQRTNAMRFAGMGEQAKDFEAKHIPGVGEANREIDKGDREKIQGFQKLDTSLADLQDFVKSHNTMIPGTKDYTTGQEKAMKLQALIREGVLGTVYREGEKPLLDKMLKLNPAGLTKWITSAQLNELRDGTNRDFNVIKHDYGIKSSPAPSQNQSQGPQIKTVNGVKYMRGPNGEAIPVK